jgi:DNA-binding GntR family transcriptional regulator
MAEPAVTEAERIYRMLREKLTSGALPPGARLVHRRIAEEFNTSNIPVIDAIRRLAGDGLIEHAPNGAATVREWSLEDIQGLFRVRGSVEGYAGELFLRKATRLDRVLLKELAVEFESAYDSGDWKRRVDADRDFHMHIVKRANSCYITQVAENTGLLSRAFFSRFGAHTPVSDRTPVEEHFNIAEALCATDPNRARKACEEHVAHSLQRFLGLMHRASAHRADTPTEKEAS